MTAFLIACLLFFAADAPQDGDAAPSASQTAAQRDHWRVAERRLTERLESPPEESPQLRTELLVRRAWVRLFLGRPAQAIEDCNAAISLDPTYVPAYNVRASAYGMQGESELAEADRRLAELVIDRASKLDEEYYSREVYPWELLPLPPWQFHPAVLLAELWGLVAVIYLAVGRRQRIQGGGTIRRWLWVSAAAAAMALAPYGVWAFSAGVLRLARPDHGLALFAVLVSVIFVALSLRPPVWLLHTKRQLELVEDEAFLARVCELAAKMRIAVPRVHLLRSTSETMLTDAFAGGLSAPSLVVTDGVLHRLAPAERDGIVAHEMAHIANGSVWLLTMIAPIACVAAVVLSAISSAWLYFGFAVFMGLRRVVHRFVEPDCDRRAAEAIGYRATASALAKIHAVNPIPQKGWLSALIHATATHPPREVRLQALLRRAPADDRPDVTLSMARIRWHRVLSWAAFVIWLSALSTPVVAWWYPEWAGWTPFPLLFVAVAPLLLLVLGLRRQMRRARRRMGGEQPASTGCLRTAIMLVAATVVFLVVPTFLPFDEELGWLVLIPVVFVVFFLMMVFWPSRTAKLQRKVAAALHLHDFQEVVRLQRTAPKVFAGDPILRHNFAVAAGLTGDRERAIAELEELRRAKPKFKLPWLALGAFYLEDGQPELALAIAEKATAELKDDPAPHGLASRALRRLGRLDEAQAAIDRALAIEPEAGKLLALAAAVTLDRNDVPGAQQLVEKAQEYAPGDAVVLVAQAEIALATEPLETARSAVQQALDASEVNPFALLSFETSTLRSRLAQREAEEGPS